MTSEHHVAASPATVHWGYFDATLPPVARIASGDTLTVETVSGGLDVMPAHDMGLTVLPEHRAIHAEVPPGPGPHILTGPIFVEGAAPGDTLAVEILEIGLRQDWGWNVIRPLLGTLPQDFPTAALLHAKIDPARRVVTMPWGLEIPAAPFFGIIGVAPPRAWGRQTSVMPRAFGGNIDNKDLRSGATLHLPVFVPGALFSVGDGHAVQGDGEVCLTAIETALTGRFRLTVVKGGGRGQPWAETADSITTMSFGEDLDDAAADSVRQMIAVITERAGLTREQAYALCSVVADVHVTQLVNVHKGAHCVLPKWALQRPRAS
jgi:acetamidase/formamidase